MTDQAEETAVPESDAKNQTLTKMSKMKGIAAFGGFKGNKWSKMEEKISGGAALPEPTTKLKKIPKKKLRHIRKNSASMFTDATERAPKKHMVTVDNGTPGGFGEEDDE